MDSKLRNALIALVMGIIVALVGFVTFLQNGDVEPTGEPPVVIVDSTEVEAPYVEIYGGGQKRTLGLNFTWNQQKQITGVENAYTIEELDWVQEARFFVYMSKDFKNGFPEPCEPGENIWQDCIAQSNIKNVNVIMHLRRLMPNATIWLNFESPDQGSWPLKAFKADWWGEDPRGKATDYFSTYFVSCAAIGGTFVFQATNEEHPHIGSDRERVYDEVRMGMVDAHRDYWKSWKEGDAEIRLSTGNRSYENRVYRLNGVKDSISESIRELDPKYLQYINDTEGWTDYHYYPEYEDKHYYCHPMDFPTNENWTDAKKFVGWVRSRYPKIKIMFGETANLEARHETRLPDDKKRKSWNRTRMHLDSVYSLNINAAALYQVENQHGKIEGKFTDSGVLPFWQDSARDYSLMNLRR